MLRVHLLKFCSTIQFRICPQILSCFSISQTFFHRSFFPHLISSNFFSHWKIICTVNFKCVLDSVISYRFEPIIISFSFQEKNKTYPDTFPLIKSIFQAVYDTTPLFWANLVDVSLQDVMSQLQHLLSVQFSFLSAEPECHESVTTPGGKKRQKT